MIAKISKKDSERIVAAIRKAEECSSGQIKVHIQKTLEDEIMKEAVEKFNELGLTATAERNGVLIFIARDARQLTIIGDEGIHSKVDKDFWNCAVDAMVERFKDDDFIGGIETGVEKVGEQLAKIFPHKQDDKNELSDDVSLG